MDIVKSSERQEDPTTAISSYSPRGSFELQQLYHDLSKDEQRVRAGMKKMRHELEDSWKFSSFGGVSLKKEKLMLDVFVTDPILVDQNLFILWLEGATAKQAALHRKSLSSGGPFDARLFPGLIVREAFDHYRNFDMLERFLQHPELFATQSFLVIDEKVFKSLLEQYYAINEDIMRELAGHKLKSKNRSALEDLSEKLRIPIRVCRRQFDNLKRIYNTIVERKKEGKLTLNVVEAIEQFFLLPRPLAERYSRYVFLSYNKIETDDKRLRFLQAQDLEYFASIMMSRWTQGIVQLDIDRKFKEDIRDCRTYLLSDKMILDTYKTHVLDFMVKQTNSMLLSDEKKVSNFSAKFSIIVKVMLNIGAGMSKSNEFEDIFEDIEEKICDVMVRMGMTEKDVHDFFLALCQTFGPLLERLTFTRHKQRFLLTWQRYVEVIRDSVLHMYTRVKSGHSSLVASTSIGQNLSVLNASSASSISINNNNVSVLNTKI